jgi:uncharacterized membrane protein
LELTRKLKKGFLFYNYYIMTENKSLSRLEAFSDGVFAIAITLLILEIDIPHGDAEASLWNRILALWPSFFAFALSFFVILVTWITHHDLIRLVRETSRPFQLANGFALLYVTFIPFVTGVLAENLTSSEASTAVALYCGTFAVGSAAFNILVGTIMRGRLLREEINVQIIRRVRRGYRIVFLIYVATTLLALVMPFLALAVNVAVRLFLLSIRYKLLWLTLNIKKVKKFRDENQSNFLRSWPEH